MDYTESAPQILAQVRAAGFDFGRPTLVEMHRAKLIERPLQRASQLYRGGSYIFYPSGTTAQVIQLLQIRKSRQMSCPDWSWAALLAGLPLPATYWMKSCAKQHCRLEAVGKRLVVRTRPTEVGPSISDRAQSVFRKLVSRRPGKVEAKMRRRAGKRAFSEFARMMVEAAFGAYVSYSVLATRASGSPEQKKNEVNWLKRTLGCPAGLLGPQKKKRPAAYNADPYAVKLNELDEMLATISSKFERTSQRKYRPEDYQLAGIELLAALKKTADIASAQCQTRNYASPGWELVSLIYRHLTPAIFFTMLVFWLQVRRFPSVKQGMSNFLALKSAY